MYFPYLIARPEEIAAIKLALENVQANAVIPILQPFDTKDDFDYQNLFKIIQFLLSKKNKFILIMDDRVNMDILNNKFNDLNLYCIRGYKSSSSTDHSNIRNKAIIHDSSQIVIEDEGEIKYHIFMPSVQNNYRYINIYPKNKSVLIIDAFVSYRANKEFPPIDNFNSDLMFKYKDYGYIGFGDFTVLPKDFVATKKPNSRNVTHVIHLSKKDDTEDKIKIFNYLTTPTEEENIQKRSKSTLEKALRDSDKFMQTNGIKLLKEKYLSKGSTATGIYKRIGISHHIEYIASLL